MFVINLYTTSTRKNLEPNNAQSCKNTTVERLYIVQLTELVEIIIGSESESESESVRRRRHA